MIFSTTTTEVDKNSVKGSSSLTEFKSEVKPKTDTLSLSNPDDDDTNDTEIFSLDHLIEKFDKKFMYQTFINGPISHDYKNSICEIIGYKNIRGIRLSTNTATSSDNSVSQFDSSYTLDNIKHIIKVDEWKNGYYKAIYKACCDFQDNLFSDDEFKQPEFLLVCTTFDQDNIYGIKIELYTSSVDVSAVDEYIRYLINDREFITALSLGYKWYFYNSHDNSIVKNITKIQSFRTNVSTNDNYCVVQ